jgi:hypothetical protein
VHEDCAEDRTRLRRQAEAGVGPPVPLPDHASLDAAFQPQRLAKLPFSPSTSCLRFVSRTCTGWTYRDGRALGAAIGYLGTWIHFAESQGPRLLLYGS